MFDGASSGVFAEQSPVFTPSPGNRGQYSVLEKTIPNNLLKISSLLIGVYAGVYRIFRRRVPPQEPQAITSENTREASLDSPILIGDTPEDSRAVRESSPSPAVVPETPLADWTEAQVQPGGENNYQQAPTSGKKTMRSVQRLSENIFKITFGTYFDINI